MEYIKNFNSFCINDDLILEKLDLKNLFYKFKSENNVINKKKIAHYIIIGLLSFYTLSQIINIINNMNLNKHEKNILTHQIDTLNKDKLYKDPKEFRLSKDGWEHIKEHEGLRLTAYALGDNMITIGYGHAEHIKYSRFKIGEKITLKEAEELLVKDANIAASGIRRMFKQWKEEEGIDIKITQEQYDVLVSMAFNMGVSGLRKSKFVKILKKEGIEKSAELIKTTGIKNFPGLKIRRMVEYEKFTKFL